MLIRLSTIFTLSIFDYICTKHWVDLYGADIESNLLFRTLFQNHWLALTVKFVTTFIALMILWKYKSNRLSIAGSWLILVAYSCLAIYHLFLLYRHISIPILHVLFMAQCKPHLLIMN